MSGQCTLASQVETACDDLSLPSRCPFFGSGDEADEQAFIYHCKTDPHDWICVGDGSDK
jgi:hypothetical protein